MTTSCVRLHGGVPSLFINDHLAQSIAAYVGPRYASAFVEAGVQLYTFYMPHGWWVGPGEYDFSAVDDYLARYVERIPGGFFMPRVNLAPEGAGWWGALHPEEMAVLRDVATGEALDPAQSDVRAVPYLGHEVHLGGTNLHSFHSQTWRAEAAEAVAALVAHCEAQPYADRIWAWHLCDGLFCEWFHWHEYSFQGLADYSPAAEADFRRWLRATYGADEARLRRAWGRPSTFDDAVIPSPAERQRVSLGEFYHPVADRPTIDYMQCFSDATVDSIIAVCAGAKRALPQPKVTCAFYGYEFSNHPRPQLNGHYALGRLLASPTVDMLASPHEYANRGEGGYHSPQAVADAIRRAGKVHFDEIDCKTVWTPASVTWKRHISQPTTVVGTIELLKKDAAYQLASGTAQWWMDLTDQGWFDAPEAVEPIRRLKAIEEQLQRVERHSFGEVALVVSQRAMMFQAARDGLYTASQLFFRNWHLSRMGAPFEQLLLSDLARPDLPRYKLYLMANLFYLSADERALIDRVVKRDGATALWVYAPGYLDDASASLANMEAASGIRLGQREVYADLDVEISRVDHPLTAGLPLGLRYGTGNDPQQYLRPPKAQNLPDMRVSPAFYAADPAAEVLGMALSTGMPGLVVKELEGWRSVYSAAPVLSWELLRNLARWAGAHVYSERGDMVWANNAFLALYAQSDGPCAICLPRTMDVIDAYDGRLLGRQVECLEIETKRWETRLLYLSQ